jgi:high-affinity nickel-transport protein
MRNKLILIAISISLISFFVVWSVALLLWRYGKIEERWHNKAHAAQLSRGENTDHAAAGMELGPIRNAFTID